MTRLDELDNQTLLDEWAKAKAFAEVTQTEMGKIELLLRQRLEQDRATAIPHPSLECRLESRHGGYDITRMPALRELLPPDVIAGAFTPAHDKVVRVPDAWDARKVGTWGKYGAEVQAAIAAAELPRVVRLVIRPKL